MLQLFLIVIDAYSKSSEVHPTSITSETTTIEKLRKVFATHGLPDMVVSNYATDFPREEFRDFMIKNAILQVKIAPRHPSYEEPEERSVQCFKTDWRNWNDPQVECTPNSADSCWRIDQRRKQQPELHRQSCCSTASGECDWISFDGTSDSACKPSNCHRRCSMTTQRKRDNLQRGQGSS